MAYHVVVQGESIASIAEQYGFFANQLWEHPGNAALKKLREDPRILLPGDRVFIPDKQRKEVLISTGQRHRFRRHGIPAMFRLNLQINGEPLRHEDYALIVEGNELLGRTNGLGQLQEYIPPGARDGELRVLKRNLRLKLQFGVLDPITEPSGVRERLRNLGFLGDVEEPLHEAIRRFQRARRLPPSGEVDQATRHALLELHDQG